MNDGDPSNPPRGRAQVPGASGGYGDEPRDEAPGRASGRAGAPGGSSTGRASVGRASIGGGGGAPGGSSTGRASVGRAGVGRGDGERTGRARVPGFGGGAAGRASAHASVPPWSPGEHGGASGADVIEGPGPGRRLPRGPKGSPPSAAAIARLKRARRRNWILGAFALFIMIAGSAVVGGTFFYDDVALPGDLPQAKQASTVYFSDGKTQMGKIGDQNRTILPPDQISQDVRNAAVATEDKDFYHNKGISYTGILRAAWNNVTGGQRQGASTITQQYAREIANLRGITYSRKLREAVLAMKLSDTYQKDTILTAYLNTVDFGRNALGIEAAAEAYFNKHAKDLTLEEGMALSAMIRNPYGGPKGLSYYDHTVNPQQAETRFDYVKQNLIEMKVVTPEKAATMKYPTTFLPPDPTRGQTDAGLIKPTGNVLHNVVDELTHAKDPHGNPMFPDLKTGGYRIITTIDVGMQAAAEKYASGATKDSPLFGQPNAIGALVSVEPYSGRVRAYYGGPTGAGNDYAGVWRDSLLTQCAPDEPKCDPDRLQGFGRHFPASSFKLYTLGAALKDGLSLNTYWDGRSPKKFDGRQAPVENAEGNTNCAGGDQHCTLWEATAESLNVPFYSLAKTIGPDKVLDFAKQAGIRYIWNLDNGSQRYDLNQPNPGLGFSPEIGIGQYAITVLDHANGVATIAARGSRAPVHFVSLVYKGSALAYKEPFKPTQIPGFSQNMADDETWALEKVLQTGTGKGLALANGRIAAAKTGTWQAGVADPKKKNNDNSNAWMVGYIAPDLSKKPQQFYGLATAVWVGAKEGDSTAVRINKQPMFGSTGPGPIWQKFMNVATANMPKTKFPDLKNVGDDTRGDSSPPAPTGPPTDPNNPGQPCLIPVLCPPNPGGQGGGNNGGGNGGGGNGGQGGGGGVTGLPPRRR
jgi:membrane peptidoglycan carboxypeptidase